MMILEYIGIGIAALLVLYFLIRIGLIELVFEILAAILTGGKSGGGSSGGFGGGSSGGGGASDDW